MRLPLLFRRENSGPARRQREAELQKKLTDGLRSLADLLVRAADRLEQQRLARHGYEPKTEFLKRTDLERSKKPHNQ